jgi:hypothetical protein
MGRTCTVYQVSCVPGILHLHCVPRGSDLHTVYQVTHHVLCLPGLVCFGV